MFISLSVLSILIINVQLLIVSWLEKVSFSKFSEHYMHQKSHPLSMTGDQSYSYIIINFISSFTVCLPKVLLFCVQLCAIDGGVGNKVSGKVGRGRGGSPTG